MPENLSHPILELRSLTCHFRQGERIIRVLDGIDFILPKGYVTALVGPSGVGKSTLLHAAGLLERPKSGQIFINGVSCADQGEGERARIRLKRLGFVYQHHHLLPEFDVEENVMMPQLIAGVRIAQAREKSRGLIEQVGMTDRRHHRPGQLSGGEQQRVALARALANRPDIILADEPTGNLDEQSASRVMDLLFDVAHAQGTSALIATHNRVLAERADHVVALSEGKLHIHKETPSD